MNILEPAYLFLQKIQLKVKKYKLKTFQNRSSSFVGIQISDQKRKNIFTVETCKVEKMNLFRIHQLRDQNIYLKMRISAFEPNFFFGGGIFLFKISLPSF